MFLGNCNQNRRTGTIKVEAVTTTVLGMGMPCREHTMRCGLPNASNPSGHSLNVLLIFQVARYQDSLSPSFFHCILNNLHRTGAACEESQFVLLHRGLLLLLNSFQARRTAGSSAGDALAARIALPQHLHAQRGTRLPHQRPLAHTLALQPCQYLSHLQSQGLSAWQTHNPWVLMRQAAFCMADPHILGC